MSTPEPGSSMSNVRPITAGQARIVKPIMRVMSRLNVWAYRASNGRVGGRFLHGAPVCLVTMTGRRSGRRITVPLIHTTDGEDVLLVASQGGMDRHPGWFYSISANPKVEIQVGAEVRRMVARRASAEEKRARWPRLVEVYPDFEEYQARTRRDIPVFICSPE